MTTAFHTQYLVGTKRKTDDVLIVTGGPHKDHYLCHATRLLYSDCVGNTGDLMYKGDVSNVRPATAWDFEFFRVKPPRDLRLEAGCSSRNHWTEDDVAANPPRGPVALVNRDWATKALNKLLTNSPNNN